MDVSRTLSGEYKLSTSASGSFNSSSTSYVDVTNLSVSFTTDGRPLRVALIPDTSQGYISVDANSGSSGSGIAFFALNSNGSIVSEQLLAHSAVTTTTGSVSVPCSALVFPFFGAAGTYTLKIQSKVSSSNQTVGVANTKLMISYW